MEIYLKHHGVKDQKWGVRHGPPYPLKVFVSGSSKTTTKEFGYYRKLPKPIKDELNNYIKNNNHIIVGDAPGIDAQVQDYIKKYENVTVYSTGPARYMANKKWKNIVISSNAKENSKEFLKQKDIAMCKAADIGLAVVLENGGASATRNNVDRLLKDNKDVKVYELTKNKKDGFINIEKR